MTIFPIRKHATEPQLPSLSHARALRRLCLFVAAFMSFGFNQSASAQDSERSWDLGIALGAGQRSNPLVNGEDIDINAVIDFTWTGRKFYFDNGDLGYTFVERRAWSFGAVATFNNERNYYNYLTGQELGLESIVRSNFAPSPDKTTPENGSDEKKPSDDQILIAEDKTAYPDLPDFVTADF